MDSPGFGFVPKSVETINNLAALKWVRLGSFQSHVVDSKGAIGFVPSFLFYCNFQVSFNALLNFCSELATGRESSQTAEVYYGIFICQAKINEKSVHAVSYGQFIRLCVIDEWKDPARSRSCYFILITNFERARTLRRAT